MRAFLHKFLGESRESSHLRGSSFRQVRGFLSTKLRNKTKASIEQLSAPNPANLSKGQRAGFTMIEIVFVIVITGLVATAGSKAIVQILQNYALQKEFAKIEMDSASAIRQISNYLQNSVWDSIALNRDKPIAEVSNHANGAISPNNRLYFIEKDMDNINGIYDGNGNNMPYFDGFINLKLSGIQDNTGTGKNRIITQTQSALNTYRQAGHAIYFPFVNVGSNISVENKYYVTPSVRSALFKIQGVWRNNDGTALITFLNNPSQIGDVAVLVNENPSYITLYDAKNGNFEKGDLVISRIPLGTTNNNDEGRRVHSIIAKKVSNLHIWTESSSSLIRLRICFEAGVVKSVMEEFCKEGIIMQ